MVGVHLGARPRRIFAGACLVQRRQRVELRDQFGIAQLARHAFHLDRDIIPRRHRGCGVGVPVGADIGIGALHHRECRRAGKMLRQPVTAREVELQRRRVGAEHDDRLTQQREVALAVGVLVRLAEQLGVRGDAAHEERGHVELLPGQEVVAQDDGDLGVEADLFHDRHDAPCDDPPSCTFRAWSRGCGRGRPTCRSCARSSTRR